MKRSINIGLLILALTLAADPADRLLDTVSPISEGRLPIDESSGIETDGSGIRWTHNDSGGDRVLYGISADGSLMRIIQINGVTNTDWEELACDEEGNLYICDVGNNSNNRTDLRIHIIPDPATIATDTVTPATIFYTYEDQTAFPPPAAEMHYDLEAVIVHGDSIFMFTKNRTDPMNGYTRLYGMPRTPGTHVAALLDSFFLSYVEMEAQLTSADIIDNILVLMSYRKIWIFQGFSGSDFFSVMPTVLTFPGVTQKEAICFKQGHIDQLWLTDELVTLYGIPIGGYLYSIDLSGYILSIDDMAQPNDLFIRTYPNPFNDTVRFSGNAEELTIYDVTGRKIATPRHTWTPTNIPSGLYILTARKGQTVITKRLLYQK